MQVVQWQKVIKLSSSDTRENEYCSIVLSYWSPLIGQRRIHGERYEDNIMANSENRYEILQVWKIFQVIEQMSFYCWTMAVRKSTILTTIKFTDSFVSKRATNWRTIEDCTIVWLTSTHFRTTPAIFDLQRWVHKWLQARAIVHLVINIHVAK